MTVTGTKGGGMDEQAREQALLTALTTEHFVLQTSRGATIAESVGRATVFLTMLSAALIGLGFVSSSGQLLKPYLGAVVPTLVITGLFTFGRLVQNMVENSLDLQRIQRIRAYYHRQFAGDHDFFADAVLGGDPQRAVWAAVGTRPGRWHLLLTTAAMVGAVNALLIGLGATLLTRVTGGAPTVAVAVGVVVALVAFAAQVAYIQRASISLVR
ncbi:hypothetical protein U2F26_19765 [Micromonospora sp. 4G57]|uniref:ABC transporter ATP-binding protein n=1 Tax=Micromonospora sicca TaxID=2202420 RepID=A0ABU5J5N2_9ACTN|nr:MULTISPECIES: hypothetical protein [unclassified Micromonospora]MDZ5444956.1 hypothetical protein [Micromonospora sp. 4G57]MDZ5487884.1 hypothetical protein [Micromonospora sp. 4G53]